MGRRRDIARENLEFWVGEWVKGATVPYDAGWRRIFAPLRAEGEGKITLHRGVSWDDRERRRVFLMGVAGATAGGAPAGSATDAAPAAIPDRPRIRFARPSSWTRDLAVAEGFARERPYGAVLSITVSPRRTLLDLARVEELVKPAWRAEREVIMPPGILRIETVALIGVDHG